MNELAALYKAQTKAMPPEIMLATFMDRARKTSIKFQTSEHTAGRNGPVSKVVDCGMGERGSVPGMNTTCSPC